ncbi:MAG: uridine kinase [Paraglaciecola sp.]|jgi:uridine kinase
MEKPFIIGLTGGSGSGKTTLINSIREEFSDDEICIVSQDDYYLKRELQEKDELGIENFDRPKSINKREFIDDVKGLMRGDVITREEYTFNNNEATAKILTFEPAPIIIVEGIFVFHYRKMRELFDLKVFLHAKENLKVIRRIKRDRMERNYPLEDVLYRYENHVMPTFEKYILPYLDSADIVINNNEKFDMGLGVVKGFLRNKINEMTDE